MKIRVDDDSNSTQVNLTPMIDVVFLLVIFFMVTTTFIQLEKEMDIDLPEASAADVITNPSRVIVINVRTDGTIRVNAADMGLEDLASLLRQAAGADPDQEVMIRGDRDADYDKVVRVLDVCKAAAIRNMTLATLEPQ